MSDFTIIEAEISSFVREVRLSDRTAQDLPELLRLQEVASGATDAWLEFLELAELGDREAQEASRLWHSGRPPQRETEARHLWQEMETANVAVHGWARAHSLPASVRKWAGAALTLRRIRETGGLAFLLPEAEQSVAHWTVTIARKHEEGCRSAWVGSNPHYPNRR